MANPLEPRLIGQNDPSKPTVFLGMPHYSGEVNINAARALFQGASLGKANIWSPDAGGSLLAHTFNQLYFAAIAAYEEGEVTHFGMLHADIAPEPGFVDILLDEMKAHDADVISCVVPFKDSSGLTSTALGDPDDEWTGTPLHMDDLCRLPPTFSIKDTVHTDKELLLNSGCMLVDLSKPWVRETDENGFLKAYFTIKDRVRRNDDGTFTRFVESEDWNFSRMVTRLGGKVFATRKVQLVHFGGHGFRTPSLEEVDEYQKSLVSRDDFDKTNTEVITLANQVLAIRNRDRKDFETIQAFVQSVDEAQVKRAA